MKRIKSSIVIILLAIIVLFTGMCSELERADSCLAYTKQVSDVEKIEQVKSDTLYIGNCTNKLISGLRDTFLRSQRGQVRISLRNYAEFLCLKEILQMLLFYSVSAVAISLLIQGSETAILEFIHSQDGEK